MRHSRVINHLGRTSSHRKSMMSNMAASMILHKKIRTTVAKAKALKTYIEPLITRSKDDSTHSRRVAFNYLKDKKAVVELFREISPKIAERPGGYTRILKTGNRLGDNAEMCILELVDFNLLMAGGGEAAKTKTARRRRSSKKKSEEVGPVKASAGKIAKKVEDAEKIVEVEEDQKNDEELTPEEK
jgi:large subunit ribosomal protein L17